VATYTARRRKRAPALAGVFDSLGATFWEYMNPDAVRAEYELQGKEPPPDKTIADVMGAAREDALETAAEAGALLTSGAKKAAWALGIGAVIFLWWKFGGRK
jgi:hypothetical protein